MAAVWGWLPLPSWLASSALWFVVLNVVVAAVAVLSRAGPPLASPRRGAGMTRRASSAVLQRLRSSIFSFPSACLHTAPPPQPDTAAAQDAEEPATARAMVKQSPRSPPLAPPPKAERVHDAVEPATVRAMVKQSPRASSPPLTPPAKAELVVHASEDDKGDDTNGMSMDEAYELALAARRLPEQEREQEARRSEVDARADEFIRGFKEDQRQQRLKSIYNYTQMLKRRAFGSGSGSRQPDAGPDQHQL